MNLLSQRSHPNYPDPLSGSLYTYTSVLACFLLLDSYIFNLLKMLSNSNPINKITNSTEMQQHLVKLIIYYLKCVV